MSNCHGRLIAFEGIDNTGKTTQVLRVADWLRSRGYDVLISLELTTSIGQCFRAEFEAGKLSPRVKALLFAADRYYRLETEIIPALGQGRIVLADRWVLSALVYRGAEGEGLSLAEFVNEDVIPPDITFLIDIDPHLAYHRGQMAQRRSPYGEEFLALARKRYLELASAGGFIIIDGSQPVELVTQDIVSHLTRLLGGWNEANTSIRS